MSDRFNRCICLSGEVLQDDRVCVEPLDGLLDRLRGAGEGRGILDADEYGLRLGTLVSRLGRGVCSGSYGLSKSAASSCACA